MDIVELAVPGAFEFSPRVFPDDRGEFAEVYRHDSMAEKVGHPLHLAQTNSSRSRLGTLRGIHYADVPPGQAKYITCSYGRVYDVVVDIRAGSPTFGIWAAIELDARKRNAVYVPEGLGHGFIALTDGAVVNYLCSTTYNPGAEHGINPLDPDLGIEWPAGVEPLLSPKDAQAPTLAQALSEGRLPSYDDCQKQYQTLRTDGGVA